MTTTLDSLDQKVTELATEVLSVKESIGPSLKAAVQEAGAAAEAANQRRHEEAVAYTRRVMARQDEALELARENHGVLIRKLTETVEAFASRSEVEELRKEVAELRTLVKTLQAKVEARS